MNRLWILLLCLLMLLTGCMPESQIPAEQETGGATEPAAAETTLPQEQESVALLDQAEAAGEGGNLFYISNPHLESMICPRIRLYGNGLLLYEHAMDGLLYLKRISLEDGRLLAEASYAVSPAVRVQVGNGFIGLSDSGTGQVLILRDSLELETTYAVAQEGENWYLNQELETLFVVYPEEGLLAYNLASGESRWILENAAWIQTYAAGSGYMLLSYTDRADQKTYARSLNFSTATLETIPVRGSITSGSRSGEQWLLRQDIETGSYVLIDQDAAGTFTWSEGMVQLLSGRRQLLATDSSYRNLYLYDLKGSFVSCCTLPDFAHASVGTDMIWSGYWQGFFFTDTYDNAAHLMFWDMDIPQEGEDIPVAPVGEVESSEPVLEPGLYRRAEELSQRFGVNIRIGEQCQTDYTHYECIVLTDPFFVSKALDVLEETLSDYPEGFLQQLVYGSLQEIRIEVSAGLRGKEDAQDHPTNINGFAQDRLDYYLIVLDGFSLDASTVYHELSHVIDKRLEWDAKLRTDALYSEEGWLALQPDGFRYAESYTEMPPEVLSYEYSGYFARSYGMTFPTEDRATVMELAMDDVSAFDGNDGMKEKLRYYAACIRDCFDTQGWPEVTCWEQILQS